MQPSAICLCIRTQLLAVDIILTSQSIDVAKRIPKCTRSGDINNSSIRIRQRKQTEPPHFARPPALVFNELIRITPCRSWQQHLHFIQKRIRRANAVEQRCRRPAKHSIRFNDRNSRCQLKDAIFHAQVIPIHRVSIDVVIKADEHVFLHEFTCAPLVPRIDRYQEFSVMMNSKSGGQHPCVCLRKAFAFIEHSRPHNRQERTNSITLSHVSLDRPCQKLTKSLTPQVRTSTEKSTIGRRSSQASQRYQNQPLQIVAVKYGLHGPNKPKNSPYFTAT